MKKRNEICLRFPGISFVFFALQLNRSRIALPCLLMESLCRQMTANGLCGGIMLGMMMLCYHLLMSKISTVLLQVIIKFVRLWCYLIDFQIILLICVSRQTFLVSSTISNIRVQIILQIEM